MRYMVYIFMLLILIVSVNAFSIVEPEDIVYNVTDILLQLEHNETLDNISYEIGNESFIGCENCSSYNSSLNLTEGNHSITATGILGNSTFIESVDFSVLLPVINETQEFTLNISSPINITYNITDIPLIIQANRTLDQINITLDEFNLVCENCSSINTSLNLTEGNYTLVIVGILGNDTSTDSVDFSVEIPDDIMDFSLEVISPESITYDNTVPLDIQANETLDYINITIDDFYEVVCYNCSEYSETLNLSEDDYTLSVKGVLENLTKEIQISFSVEEPDEEPEDDETDEDYPRFAMGFNKLPKMLMAGEITDEELAEIIRNNYINPGIINRLIKTGLLENESIDAILETQFTPRGIFRKLFSGFGFRHTYASKIYEHYHLSSHSQNKLLARDDLPKGQAQKIQEQKHNQIRKQIINYEEDDDEEDDEEDVEDQDDEEDYEDQDDGEHDEEDDKKYWKNKSWKKQPVQIGRQNKGNGRSNGYKKIPPGQAKKGKG